MVQISSRFAVIATVASMALSTAEAVALPAPRSDVAASSSASKGHEFPMPMRLANDRKKTTGKKNKGGKTNGEKHARESVQLARDGDQAFFASRFARRDKIVLSGDHQHVRFDGHHHHGHHWDSDWDHDYSKIKLTGDHNHVKFTRRGEPSSSVIVKNAHGQSFVVSRAHHAFSRRSEDVLERRFDEDAPVGTIDLMLRNDAGGQPKKLGSLYVNSDKTPWELDASSAQFTKTYLVSDQCLDPSTDPNVKFVQLHYPAMNPTTLKEVPMCATYNSSPDHPAPMTLEGCECPTDAQRSQTFMYTVDSGVVTPMSMQDAAASPSAEPAPPAAAAAGVEDETMESATSFQARQAPPPQNVTLVFTPDGPQQHAESIEAADDKPMASTVTATVTETVTATPTPSAAAADAEEETQSVSASVTASTSSALPSSSASSTAAMDALNVEVSRPSSSASASDMSTSSLPTTAMMESSSAAPSPTASSSVNAEAIASGIANPDSSSSSSSASETTASTATIAGRAEYTPVSTDPYKWQFQRDVV